MSIKVEANTRFIIDSILTNKGWHLDPSDKKKMYFLRAT